MSLVFALMAGSTATAWLAVSMFALFLLAFFAGTLSGTLFLARSSVVQPGPRFMPPPPRVIESSSRSKSNGHTGLASRPAPREVPGKSDVDTPVFASSRDADRILEIAVLISANDHPPDPAEGTPPVTPQIDWDDPVVFPRATAEDVPHVTVELAEPGPYPGSVLATADGEAPQSDYCVKGNIRSMKYHTVQSPNFHRTKAGVWFRSIDDAEQAGFSAWNRRAQLT